jgi:transposase-like protein
MLTKRERFAIAQRLYEQGQSLRHAAHVAGVSASGLWKYLARHGIARRTPGAPRKLTAYVKEQILREHLNEGVGVSTLARRHGVSKETIRRVFAEHGKLTYSLAQVKRVQALKRDREVYTRVIDLYRKGFPVKEIAKTVRTSQRRVSRIVRTFIQGLPQAVFAPQPDEEARNVGDGQSSAD